MFLLPADHSLSVITTTQVDLQDLKERPQTFLSTGMLESVYESLCMTREDSETSGTKLESN